MTKKKIGYIVDSFSPYLQKNIDLPDNVRYLPLTIYIDGKSYKDGIDIQVEDVFEKIVPGNGFKTSQPSPKLLIDLYNELSPKYEDVIYFPVGSAISGTYQTAVSFSREYKNIHVINNTFVGREFKSIIDELNSIDADFAIANRYINKMQKNTNTYVVPKNNLALIKGGRINGFKSLVLKVLKSFPVISFKDKVELKNVGIKRKNASAIKFAIKKQIKFIEQSEFDLNDFVWEINHTNDMEPVNVAIEAIKEETPNIPLTTLTSSIVVAYTGLGAISISVYPKEKRI
ncbi:MAG: DegV family protein [Mollicutes bacterium PWAP]|nr:DegV family protein [Mollicutes bacterium PWAP]